MMPVLILAAGASSRMGDADKLMLDVDGMPMLRRQALIALGVSADVRVALPPPPHPRHDTLSGLAVQHIAVPDAAEGINASLRRVFASLAPDVPHAMLLLGDLPALTVGDLRAVMSATITHPDARIWQGATPDGKGGHPMVFAASLFAAFQDLTGDSGGRAIVMRAADDTHKVLFSDDRARRDVDTPEDWAAWQRARARSNGLR